MDYQALGDGITCIDAGYVKPGIACFYLLQQDDQYAVIETGTSHSVGALQQLLAQRDIAPEQVRYIIPTHVHLDHAGGAGVMMAAFEQAQLLIHPRGARHMVDPERLVASATAVYGEETFNKLYGAIVPIDAARVREVADGESVELSGRRLEFRHTRGHANHHFCIWDEASRGWFSGDMFGVSYPWFRFSAGDFVMPSTTPTQFDPQTYLQSLQLLASYSPQCMYLTHYGKLAYSAEKAQLLVRQVEAYCEYAVAHGADTTRLNRALADYSVQLLRQFDEDTDEAQLRDYLAFDVPLNTQGLQVWQQQLQKG